MDFAVQSPEILMLAAVGLIVLLVYSLREIVKGGQVKSWPRATATIRNARIDSRKSYSGHGPDMKYRCTVQYSYQVNNEEYQGHRIHLKDAYIADEGPVLKQMDTYMPGTVVEAYYNPANPEIAVLEVGASRAAWMLFTGAGILLLIISWLLVYHSA